MKKIPITQGKYVIVDDEDYDWLNQWKWQAYSNCKHNWYAVRKIYTHSKSRSIRMHRQILGLKVGDGKTTDHINRNSLDNRRRNIRIVTCQQNNFNRRSVKGYCWSKDHKKWRGYIKLNGKLYHLGYFDNELDAHKAYLCAKQKYHKIN